MTYAICLVVIPAGWFAWRQWRHARRALKPALRAYGFGNRLRGPVRFK